MVVSRQAKDPDLNEMANQLKEVQFTPNADLDVAFKEMDRLFYSGGEWPFRGVNLMPDQTTWSVRLYIGGEQRRIGATTNGCHACRFADLALLTFWKYRIRGASEPLDAHMNFSVAQAKLDMVAEEEANFLLAKIEGHLIKRGVLPTAEKLKEMEAARTTNRRAVERRKTVKWDLLDRFAVFERTTADVIKKLDEVNQKIDGLSMWLAQEAQKRPGAIIVTSSDDESKNLVSLLAHRIEPRIISAQRDVLPPIAADIFLPTKTQPKENE